MKTMDESDFSLECTRIKNYRLNVGTTPEYRRELHRLADKIHDYADQQNIQYKRHPNNKHVLYYRDNKTRKITVEGLNQKQIDNGQFESVYNHPWITQEIKQRLANNTVQLLVIHNVPEYEQHDNIKISDYYITKL